MGAYGSLLALKIQELVASSEWPRNKGGRNGSIIYLTFVLLRNVPFFFMQRKSTGFILPFFLQI
jgi:hypothetical protein